MARVGHPLSSQETAQNGAVPITPLRTKIVTKTTLRGRRRWTSSSRRIRS